MSPFNTLLLVVVLLQIIVELALAAECGLSVASSQSLNMKGHYLCFLSKSYVTAINRF